MRRSAPPAQRRPRRNYSATATVTATGRVVRVRSSCASPSCGAAAPARPSSNLVAWPRSADRIVQQAFVQGISTRSVRQPGAAAMGMEGLSESQSPTVWRDRRTGADFLSRPIEATGLISGWTPPTSKPAATTICLGGGHRCRGNTDGRREVLGMTSATARPSPSGSSSCAAWPVAASRAKLVVSDAHEGLKAAIVKILGPPGSVPRPLHRNALAYAGKTQRRIVSAWVGTAFTQDDAQAARSNGARWPTSATAAPQAGYTDG